MTKERSVFISHATIDKDYGQALKNLLKTLMPNQRFFYSSSEFDGVQANQNINESIKNEIRNDAYVIFLLSDHFYSSAACLNEMGAAWISGNKYALVILPGFDIGGDDFRRSLIDIHQKVVCIWNQADILQLAESLLSEFGIADNKHDTYESCLEFTSKINENKRNEIGSIPVYERLRKAEKKIAAGVNIPEAYSERGKARSELKQYDLAAQDYLYSIFLKPDDINTYNRMIQAVGMADAGFGEWVMVVAEEMCRRFPDDHRSYGCRGYVKSHTDDIEGGIADCDKALAIRENHWHYNTRGRCWAAKGESGQEEMQEYFRFKALEDYWRSHHISPEYKPAINNIGFMVAKIKPERIKEEVKKAEEAGDEKTVQIYKECLEIAGVV